ncbi:MAG: class I SAM-dependent methyltransferase, partial [Actinomycetota bacterium]
MLDKRMIYTCGYWQHADDLDSAQEAKLDLVCRKLELQPGMRVLDIG